MTTPPVEAPSTPHDSSDVFLRTTTAATLFFTGFLILDAGSKTVTGPADSALTAFITVFITAAGTLVAGVLSLASPGRERLPASACALIGSGALVAFFASTLPDDTSAIPSVQWFIALIPIIGLLIQDVFLPYTKNPGGSGESPQTSSSSTPDSAA